MIGQTISHYKILEKLGEGGMGVVYKAQDIVLNRFVALKFLPPHLTKDESTRKRFIVEAQAASALDHPNICNIHEINETPDGKLFICMAYYEGESLREKIDDGPIPFDESIKIFSQITQGLKVAHEKNIIHRDIKPGNILIAKEGEVKIVDFGLAKLSGMDLTKTTSSKGTAAYMCPEQIRGQKVDHRCDIWALGIVFYEMLTGHLPFEAEYPEPMMYAIVNEEPKPLSHHLDNVPESLQDIITKLLKKDPKERYSDMSEILHDFQTHIKTDDSELLTTKPAFKRILQQKRIYAYVGIIILLILFYLSRSYFLPQHSKGNKIAVLPVESSASDTEQEWFNEGMTDELITKLAQISSLRVTSRSSSIQYKGTTKTTPQIASELGVQYLVETSSIKNENQVEIKAKLIDASKDEYLWAKEYESDLKNILVLLGEIAQEIASQIQVKLTPQEKTRLSVKRQVNPETYVMYLNGMYQINKRTKAGMKKGLEYLHQAAEYDPAEPLAQAGLALGYCIIAHSPGPSSNADAPKLAKEAALKALELDENLAEVHLALAMVSIYFNWDKPMAERSYKRALELNPSLPLALMHYSWFEILMGNSDESPKLMKRAIEVDPLSNIYPAELAWMHYWRGEYDKTIEQALKSLELVPDFPFALFALGEGYAGKGMYEKAIEIQKKSAELSPSHKFGLAHTYALAGYANEALKIAAELENNYDIWNTWCLAVVYAALEDDDKVFYWLEKAYEQRHPYIQWLKSGYFDAYKYDPRYESLVQRMNLPE
jgi:eukaryotic-like serine/threonine-protein kinase